MNCSVCIVRLESVDAARSSAVAHCVYAVERARPGVRWDGLGRNASHECQTRVAEHVTFLFQSFPFFLQSKIDAYCHSIECIRRKARREHEWHCHIENNSTTVAPNRLEVGAYSVWTWCMHGVENWTFVGLMRKQIMVFQIRTYNVLTPHIQ